MASSAVDILSPGTPRRDEGVTRRLYERMYVTRTGTKYHVRGCRHLARSQIPMALAEAAARYRACADCRPPIPHRTQNLRTSLRGALPFLQPHPDSRANSR